MFGANSIYGKPKEQPSFFDIFDQQVPSENSPILSWDSPALIDSRFSMAALDPPYMSKIEALNDELIFGDLDQDDQDNPKKKKNGEVTSKEHVNLLDGGYGEYDKNWGL